MMDFSNTRFKGSMAAGWIKDLKSSDSRIHKEKVIEKALMAAKLGSADAQAFLFNCYQAYNPFYSFNVRQVPETKNISGQVNPWPDFWTLLEKLRTRYITGNRARDAIEQLSQQFDSDEWNTVAKPVILKDLRCGISEKTINKIVGNTDWAIPTFSCQLAQDSAKNQKEMSGKKQLEVKLDGVRVLAVVHGNTCVLHSRNGKILQNFPQIEDAIVEHRSLFRSHPLGKGRFVLDGEIVGDSFQNLMKQAHRKSNVETADMTFHVFDYIPLDDFQRGHWNAQQRKRIDVLREVANQLEDNIPIKIVPGVTVDLDTEGGHRTLERFSKEAIDQGFEGIMIKELEAPYQCKRSSAWLKWKPTITVDLNIVALEEGTGRNKNRLGALVCKGVDDDRTIEVNVGSGFTDKNREEYWAARDQLIGHLVEIQADVVTQNQDGTYSLRFPRFVRFRDFESGSKI